MALGDIAAKIGLPVFPCNGEKRPLSKGGFHTATADQSAILAAFRHDAATLIGVPTGTPSGIIVIDVDVKPGQSGMAWLDDNREVLPETRTHHTRSGGLHLLFRRPEGVSIRNSAGKLATGVDVRGEGGYVIFPPSPGYTVADHTEPAEMPDWLIRACASREHEAPPQTSYAPNPGGSTKYGLAALENECAAVRAAPFGRQETTLNNASLKIGALVAGAQLVHSVAESELISAGMSMLSEGGKPAWSPAEIRDKVKRGMADGSALPRAPEQRERIYSNGHTQPESVPYDEETGEIFEAPAPSEDPKAENYTGDLFKLTWFSDIEAMLDTQDFVQGLLIEGSSGVVFGESNAGKTFWTTDLALHVATGKRWNNRRVEQGGVIYCALEGGVGFKNRVAAWKKQHEIPSDVFVPFAAIQSGINLLDPTADTPKLIATINQAAAQIGIPIKLVVIDTLARAMAGGNENASEDMGALVMNIDRIREQTKACTLAIHHSGKDQSKGSRGHSSLRGAIDTEIEVVAEDGAEAKTATVLKQRELKKGDCFGFTLLVADMGQNRHGEPVTTCTVVHSEGSACAALPPTRLSGHKKRALQVLTDVISESGKSGFSGTPTNVMTVPEAWWRDRFYLKACPGDNQDAKQKAFRRAASDLVTEQVVGMNEGRVWIVKQAFQAAKAPRKEAQNDPF